MTQAYVEYILNDDTLRKSHKEQGAFQVYCMEVPNVKIVGNIHVDGYRIGSVILIDCQSAIQACDLELMEMVTFMVGDMLKKCETTRLATKTDDILFLLLEKQISSGEALDVQLRLAKVQLPKEKQLVVFDFSQHTQDGMAQSRDTAIGPIQHQCKFVLSLFYRTYLVALCNAGILADMVREIEAVCCQRGLVAGVSDVFQNPLDMRDHFNETLTLLRLGGRAYDCKRVFCSHHVALFSALPEINADQAYKEYCHPALKKLREYDKAHQTDLFKTLYVYLMSGCNVQKSAKKLYLHRNSLRNRVAKATEYAKIDLANTLETSDIILSYRILKFYWSSQLFTETSEQNTARKDIILFEKTP